MTIEKNTFDPFNSYYIVLEVETNSSETFKRNFDEVVISFAEDSSQNYLPVDLKKLGSRKINYYEII